MFSSDHKLHDYHCIQDAECYSLFLKKVNILFTVVALRGHNLFQRHFTFLMCFHISPDFFPVAWCQTSSFLYLISAKSHRYLTPFPHNASERPSFSKMSCNDTLSFILISEEKTPLHAKPPCEYGDLPIVWGLRSVYNNKGWIDLKNCMHIGCHLCKDLESCVHCCLHLTMFCFQICPYIPFHTSSSISQIITRIFSAVWCKCYFYLFTSVWSLF